MIIELTIYSEQDGDIADAVDIAVELQMDRAIYGFAPGSASMAEDTLSVFCEATDKKKVMAKFIAGGFNVVQ